MLHGCHIATQRSACNLVAIPPPVVSGEGLSWTPPSFGPEILTGIADGIRSNAPDKEELCHGAGWLVFIPTDHISHLVRCTAGDYRPAARLTPL